MKRLVSLVSLAVAALMLVPGSVSAAPPAVSINGVTVDGENGHVSGTASFEAVGTQSVLNADSTRTNGTLNATDAGKAIGIKLEDASITPIAGGLRFTWHLNALPEHFLPEVVRYTWAFQIGERPYQLIAKRTNLMTVNVADDPLSYIERLQSQKAMWTLRGNCGSWRGAINGCYHLAFLEGSFDAVNKRISMDMPFETKDSIGRLVAPDFKPGAVVKGYQGTFVGGTAITASVQYGPLSQGNVTPVVTDTINGLSPYYIGPQVSLAVAAPKSDPTTLEYTIPTTLSGSTFSGTVKGLSSSKNTVYAQACSGTECSYTSLKAL